MEFDIQTYFVELGKLLYAIAKSDGRVQVEERKKLNEIVRNELVEICRRTDEFGTNLAFYSEFSFDTISDRNLSAEIAYNSFINFLNAHKDFIPEKLCKISISSVRKIAESSQGIVETEQKFIDRLESDIQKIYNS